MAALENELTDRGANGDADGAAAKSWPAFRTCLTDRAHQNDPTAIPASCVRIERHVAGPASVCDELLGAFIDFAVDSRELAAAIDRDPAVLAIIDEVLPMSSQEMTEQVIAVLAGPGADHAATIRAHAAFAVIKGATMATMSLGTLDSRGKLDPADRAEILDAALRAQRR